MWRSYLTATLRHVLRYRLTTLLNVSGLSLGYAAALLASLYVMHERTYDRFIPGHKDIHVVVSEMGMRGQDTRIGEQTSAYLAGWLRADFTTAQTARLLPVELLVRHGEIEASEKTGWADPDFFAMLRLPAIAGDPATALGRPENLVITRRMARKYFGRDAPLGETLEFPGGQALQVAAVIEDLPAATHLVAEIYGSGLNRAFGLQKYDDVPWPVDGQTPVVTYVRMPAGSGTSIADIQAAMPRFVQRHMGRLIDLFKSQLSIDLQLVPLDRLHLHPAEGSMKPHGSASIVTAVGIAGLLIVLVAVINFVNLTTAHASRRAVEVGVRKVAGARRQDLIAQFMGESLLHAGAAMLIAVLLVNAALPGIDARLAPGIAEQWSAVNVFAIAGGLAVLAGALGGSYPALVLSAHHPVAAFDPRLRLAGSGTSRQLLVALQFSVLIALVVATLVILQQTRYSLRDGLRFPQDQLLLVYAPCPTIFTEQLRGLPGVAGAACAGADPSSFNPGSLTQANRADGTPVSLGISAVGFGLLEVLGVQPLAGRLYDPVRDAAAVGNDRAPLAVLNESAVRAMGFTSPQAAIGQSVASIQNQGGPPSEVIGVVPDFTFDLQGTRIGPVVYWPRARFPGRGAIIYVKLDGQGVPETLDAIDALWKRVGEPRPLRRLFMEQHLQERYVATIRQAYVVSGLSILAIVIAALGLFGLSAFTAEQRTREIGIRKVMGATRRNILGLLLWQFAKPVLWANLIAWPLAWFFMQRWLEGFANHITIQPWMFLAASALAVAVALLTVIGHALLVSRARPVAALRYE